MLRSTRLGPHTTCPYARQRMTCPYARQRERRNIGVGQTKNRSVKSSFVPSIGTCQYVIRYHTGTYTLVKTLGAQNDLNGRVGSYSRRRNARLEAYTRENSKIREEL